MTADFPAASVLTFTAALRSALSTHRILGSESVAANAMRFLRCKVLTAARDHVGGIVGVRPAQEMHAADARRVIAAMAD
jgi:hypothetical protein